MNTIPALGGSLSLIIDNWQFWIYLLSMQLALSALVARLLAGISVDTESLAALSFLGGMLGLTLFSLGVISLGVRPSPLLGGVTAIVSIGVLILRRQELRTFASSTPLWLFFGLVLLLRLTFVENLIVPPYADSVQHLQIVSDFLGPGDLATASYRLSLDAQYYYHVGFHALAAFLSGATSLGPIHAILLLGQYFQALAILGIFPVAWMLTRNSLSTWGMLVVGGLILSVPGYASNWGKYPAIASLTGLCFGLSLLLIFTEDGTPRPKKLAWLIILTIFATIFLHSRSVFVFLLAGIGIFVRRRAGFLHEGFEVSEKDIENRVIVTIVWTVPLYLLIRALEISPSPMLQFLNLLFLGLCLLAFYRDFQRTWALTSIMLVMGVTLLFPMAVPGLSNRYAMIFDRPYLVVFSYLPMSFLIWRGLEGGVSLLSKREYPNVHRWLFGSVLVLGLANALFVQNHHPSNCCVYVDDNDLFTFHWMKQNVSQSALVAVAATGDSGNLLPADGGIWIEYFTGIPTRKLNLARALSVTFDRADPDVMELRQKLCHQGITHFYVDGLENSFDEYYVAQLGTSHLFGMGDVQIYGMDCNQQP